MSSDISFEGKGIKGAKEQRRFESKYGFIAAYELGYADVAFGDLTLLAKKATSGGVIG